MSQPDNCGRLARAADIVTARQHRTIFRVIRLGKCISSVSDKPSFLWRCSVYTQPVDVEFVLIDDAALAEVGGGADVNIH